MRYLGIDLGSKTIGLAMSDQTCTIASPFKTIFFDNEDYLSTIEAADSFRQPFLFLLGRDKGRI